MKLCDMDMKDIENQYGPVVRRVGYSGVIGMINDLGLWGLDEAIIPQICKAGMEEASFERFSLYMTKEQAEDCSHRGDCLPDVKALLEGDPDIGAQLDKIGAGTIRDELVRYGCWDDEELKDDVANRNRIVWLAAGHISEEVRKDA
jgi:hypothetical protein